ncbi:MAG: hypothetical protein U0R64_00400 [Candidatus Nanopelagicales bacterium]
MSTMTASESDTRRRGPRRNVIVVVVVLVAVACLGGAIAWRSSAAQPASVVGTWRLVSVQHRDGTVTTIPAKADAYLEVNSDGMMYGKDGVGAIQGAYTITGDQLRVTNVALALIGRPRTPPVMAYAQLFDETATSVVPVAGDALTMATTDYKLAFRATTPRVEITPTPISPSPQP